MSACRHLPGSYLGFSLRFLLLFLHLFFHTQTHGISTESHQKTRKGSPLPNWSHRGHQNCSAVPIQVNLSSSKKSLDVQAFGDTACHVLRPANHPAERLHLTNAFHLCLGILFLVHLPKHLLWSMVPGSTLDFPNCTAAFPTSVVELLTIVE